MSGEAEPDRVLPVLRGSLITIRRPLHESPALSVSRPRRSVTVSLRRAGAAVARRWPAIGPTRWKPKPTPGWRRYGIWFGPGGGSRLVGAALAERRGVHPAGTGPLGLVSPTRPASSDSRVPRPVDEMEDLPVRVPHGGVPGGVQRLVDRRDGRAERVAQQLGDVGTLWRRVRPGRTL